MALSNVVSSFLVCLPASAVALDRVREIAPGWDRQWLLATYKGWRAGKPEPDNPDQAFLGWVRKFTKGKPPQ